MSRWQAAIERWEQAAIPLRGMTIVVQHRSWVYLQAWLGLEEVAAIDARWEAAAAEVTIHEVKPRRSDVTVELCALAWVPWWEVEDPQGRAVRRVRASR